MTLLIHTKNPSSSHAFGRSYNLICNGAERASMEKIVKYAFHDNLSGLLCDIWPGASSGRVRVLRKRLLLSRSFLHLLDTQAQWGDPSLGRLQLRLLLAMTICVGTCSGQRR